ncbi:uncharacterized protein LOC133171481 [Saccostrea echinata]|uniref:uncharacterized protein LOC133171481 n=1 Tax=Saccostrea echinata TaxID=191078 RepID=UPI002A82B960|nr:uncharacterized protein LOC133171481 [Saccostrea echinata]
MSNHANISTDVYVKVLITEKGLWGNLKTMGIQYWIILSSALFLFILTAFSIVIITCNRKTKQIQQNYHLIKEESNSVYAVPKEEKREGLFAGLMRDSVYAGHKLNNLTFSTHLKSDKQIGSEQVYMHLKHFNEEI